MHWNWSDTSSQWQDIPMLSCTASNGWVKVCGMLRANMEVYFSTACMRSTSACGWADWIRSHASLHLKSSIRPMLLARCWKQIQHKQCLQQQTGKYKARFCFHRDNAYNLFQNSTTKITVIICIHTLCPSLHWLSTARNLSIKFKTDNFFD